MRARVAARARPRGRAHARAPLGKVLLDQLHQFLDRPQGRGGRELQAEPLRRRNVVLEAGTTSREGPRLDLERGREWHSFRSTVETAFYKHSTGALIGAFLQADFRIRGTSSGEDPRLDL